MDSKNVIAAISLSAAVIILYSLFFAPPPKEIKKVNNESIKKEQSSDTPLIEENENLSKLSREDALNENKRFNFENENIKGSISLTGGVIDDLIFKNYTETLNGNDKIVLLNPRQMDKGYYVETGWVSNNKNIKLPNSKTQWSVKGNSKLSPKNPVTLVWKNKQNLEFQKIFKIDDKFLFTVNQKIINGSDKVFNFYPYGQIIRNKAPEITNFYILHEGLIGVFDEELVEKDYDDIEEKQFTKNTNNGWLGITDKYWITTLIPKNNKEFRSDFDFKNKYRASFIETEPMEVSSNTSISSKTNIIIAAKEVDVIDGYADNLKINKFDLAIDWGWFYFFTKNFFFAIDYFFRLTGNFGIAIILITACIRIVFFPLANYSFRSMAKMKVLQPEMTRLKELHKDDKMKLQLSLIHI